SSGAVRARLRGPERRAFLPDHLARGPGTDLGRAPARHRRHAAADRRRTLPDDLHAARARRQQGRLRCAAARCERPFDPPSPQRASNHNTVFSAHGGYLVVNYSGRGWGDPCGAPASRTAVCATGWIRLADQRWEVRDTQHLMGMLVDAGLSDPDALGATGVSYGGGQSLQLAAQRYKLRNTSG